MKHLRYNTYIANRSKIYKLLIFMIFILSIIYCLLYLDPSPLGFDEDYTLSLIHHSYRNIIYFDSMDVHPVLYYFLLKIFINSTTFWTTYIPLKVLSARLFSILTFLCTFIYLHKILQEFHIYVNVYIQWVLFIILPGVLGSKFIGPQLTDIRMYALASLFITAEFYYLIRFNTFTSNKYLILSTIFAILAAYTHYYTALFGGLLLFIYFLDNIIKRRYKISLKFCISGILLIISFLPWLPIFQHQVENPNTYWMTNNFEIKEIIKFFIILFVFLIPFLIKINNNKIVIQSIAKLSFVIIFVFMFSVVYSLIKGPIFQCRYMVPIILIYEFISVNMMFVEIKYYLSYRNKSRCSKLTKFYFWLVILILLFSNVGSIKNQIVENHYSINSVKIYNRWIRDNNDIYITNNQINMNYCNDYLFNMFSLKKHYLILKSNKKQFKHDTHIYYNSTYEKLFKNIIKRIYFINS